MMDRLGPLTRTAAPVVSQRRRQWPAEGESEKGNGEVHLKTPLPSRAKNIIARVPNRGSDEPDTRRSLSHFAPPPRTTSSPVQLLSIPTASRRSQPAADRIPIHHELRLFSIPFLLDGCAFPSSAVHWSSIRVSPISRSGEAVPHFSQRRFLRAKYDTAGEPSSIIGGRNAWDLPKRLHEPSAGRRRQQSRECRGQKEASHTTMGMRPVGSRTPAMYPQRPIPLLMTTKTETALMRIHLELPRRGNA